MATGIEEGVVSLKVKKVIQLVSIIRSAENNSFMSLL